ncbi:MAG: lysine--tRNA ligase [Candidatus Bathyarchaeia archaeon]
MKTRRKIIGRGTWIDKVAYEVIDREKKLGRKPELIRTESGLGASGIPHLGSLSDGVRAYGIKLAIEEFGHKSEYIAFSDDMDGLRRVPTGLPKSLEKYLGYPVTSIPDPFNCHESYGKHMSSLLLDALDRCGIEYRYHSATEAYKKGLFNDQIGKLLISAKKVGKILMEELGHKKYLEVLPYFPVCENCGRIYTTKATEFFSKEKKVLYVCEGMEIKRKWLEGCGYRGEVDYTKGDGKLSWIGGEFAARWDAFKINFEAYGKDIADSVRVNDRICEEILGYAHPFHIKYEMFLDKSGKKISKSIGNVFTPQVWLRYGSPQSLLLLMFKRFIGTRTLDITDIPQYMNELDELEAVYFGKKRMEDEYESIKLKGLYEYCWLLKPPKQPSIHVPYNLLVYLAKIAPKGCEHEFIIDKLKLYGYAKDSLDHNLRKRIEYALNWKADFVEIKETRIELSESEKRAIQELINFLNVEENAEKIQSAIFSIAKNNGLTPKDFFKQLYRILLGTTEGPKLGPYIVSMERTNVVKALEKAIS